MIYSRLNCALMVIVMGFTGSHAQTSTPAKPSALTESNQLNEQVIRLYGDHKYDEALVLAKRALDLAESALGPADSQLFSLLINLGLVYFAKFDFDNGKASFERAIEIGEKNFGSEDLKLIRPLDELGYRLSNWDELDKAIAILSRSLVIKRNKLPGHIEVARASYVLGDTYQKKGEYARAGLYFQDAVQIYKQLGASRSPEYVEVLRRYLVALTKDGKTKEAAAVQSELAELSADDGVVEAGVINGRAVKLVQPAVRHLIRGDCCNWTIRVRVLVDESGKVIEAKAEPPSRVDLLYHQLIPQAESAARRSQFTPALKSGVPVKARGIIVYEIRMSRFKP